MPFQTLETVLVTILLMILVNINFSTGIELNGNICNFDYPLLPVTPNGGTQNKLTLDATSNATNADNCDCVLQPKEDALLNIDAMFSMNEDAGTSCPTLTLEIEPPENIPKHHICSHENKERRTQSTFYLKGNEKLHLLLRNRENKNIDIHISVTGHNLENIHIVCQKKEPSTELKWCPCNSKNNGGIEVPVEKWDSNYRLMVGLVAALCFLLAVGGCALVFWIIKRRKHKKEIEEEKRVPSTEVVSPNLAYEHPDTLYSEIGKVDHHRDPLPFTPDPSLKLGLHANMDMSNYTYQGSRDSGLYSLPNELDKLSGQGALALPAMLRISNTSLSQSSTAVNPSVIMTPMNPQEIDALYSKPNKVKRINKGNQPQNQYNTSVYGPPPPLYPMSVRSQSQDNLRLAPPLASGSRSNSNSNVYVGAPLTIPPPGPLEHAISGNLNGMPTADLSLNEIYVSDNSQSQRSFTASMATGETDV